MPYSEDAVSNAAAADLETIAANDALQDGIRAAQAGRRPQARASLLRAAELDPKNENTWLWLASISEYPEELLVFLNNVLEINPQNERALQWTAATRSLLAKTFVQRGIDASQGSQSEFAVECFNKALEYDQRNSMAWLWLASLSESNEGKIAYLEKVLDIEPDNNEAKLGIERAKSEINDKLLAEAREAAVAGRSAEAIELVDAITEISPECVDAWILRSHLVDGFDEKIRCFDRVLEIRPEHSAARAGRESLLAIVGTVAETRQAAEQDETIPDREPRFDSSVTADRSPTQDLELPAVLLEEGNPFFQPYPETDACAEYDENETFTQEPNPFIAQEAADFFAEPADGDGEQYDGTIVASEPPIVSPQNVFDHNNGRAVEAAFETVVVENRAPFEPEFSRAGENDFNALENVFEKSNEHEASTEIPMPDSCSPAEEPMSIGYETVIDLAPRSLHPEVCSFCFAEKEVQTIVCQTCMAVLTLSDLEMLLANQHADRALIGLAVENMERERETRELTEAELTMLGIGHLNLRNLPAAYSSLLEASRSNPANVVLNRQVNALHIRMEEIRDQEEAHGKMSRGKSILVVDDSATVRKLIAGKLEKSGHSVVCSNDGVEALERLEGFLPDLILLDITMPRLDGYQVCKAIRSNPETMHIPVVMISGKDGFFDKVRGKMAGTTGYITKPFGPETLMKTVEMYLRGESEEIVQ